RRDIQVTKGDVALDPGHAAPPRFPRWTTSRPRHPGDSGERQGSSGIRSIPGSERSKAKPFPDLPQIAAADGNGLPGTGADGRGRIVCEADLIDGVEVDQVLLVAAQETGAGFQRLQRE